MSNLDLIRTSPNSKTVSHEVTVSPGLPEDGEHDPNGEQDLTPSGVD